MEHRVDRPFYSAYAWAYDLLITRPVARDCACIATLLTQRGVAPGSRVLDAGCGTGGYALELVQHRRGGDCDSPSNTVAQTGSART
jgi:cyclopropane fatty-acyl-phospholipid synthase-like methyltransferase